MITFIIFCLLVYGFPFIALTVFLIGFIVGLLDR